MMKLKSKKGFTLAELLIVVAIIAILVGIAIPVFTVQLNKAKAAVDLANVRNAYSIAQMTLMTDGTNDDAADTAACKAAIDQALAGVEAKYPAGDEKGFEIAIKDGAIETLTLGGHDLQFLENYTNSGTSSTVSVAS